MAEKTLSNPTIEVNSDVVGIIPNSLVSKNGIGDKDVKAQSAGGNSISAVITENAETKVSMVKFKLYNTLVGLQKVKDWSALFGSTIEISEDDFAESFQDMIVCTEPERAVGADGELEVEFKGIPTL